MADVDDEALIDANKGLPICFTICIFLVNVALLFKIYKKNHTFMTNEKHLTLVSLAIGDIFLALFSLVVHARLYFPDDTTNYIGCRTIKSASIYLEFLLPFVYGVGLCMLALELGIRQKAQASSSTFPDNQSHTLKRAVIFSAIPWLLGLVIILPITMPGLNWNDPVCRYSSMSLSRYKAMYCVSIIVPAVVAFGCCLLIMCMKSSPQPTQQVIMAPTASETTATPSAVPQSAYLYNNNGNEVSSTSQQSPAAIAPGWNQYQYPQQSPGYLYPTQTPDQYHNVSHYPPPQPYDCQPVVSGQAPCHLPHSQPVTWAPAIRDLSAEKNTLMVTAFLFCICVIPWPAFTLAELDGIEDNWSYLAYVVVQMLFYWLIVLRSFITPFVWLSSSNL